MIAFDSLKLSAACALAASVFTPAVSEARFGPPNDAADFSARILFTRAAYEAPDFLPSPSRSIVLVRDEGRGRPSRALVEVKVFLSADKEFDASEDTLVGTETLRMRGRAAVARVELDAPDIVPGFNVFAVVEAAGDVDLGNNLAHDDRLLRRIGGTVITLLHNNDGESQLLESSSAGADFGGVARFGSLVAKEKAGASSLTDGYLFLSSGDNFLAGSEFDATLNTLDSGSPMFFDARALDLLDYDGIVLGNHDFDFGPNLLADFLEAFTDDTVYLSANLDFSANAALSALEDEGRLTGALVVETGGTRLGVVGATTPQLPSVSSPGNVQIIDADNDGDSDVDDVALLVQAEIDALLADGIHRIVFVSHLQGFDTDIELVGQLRGIDLWVAGGGDELLVNTDDSGAPEVPLIPGDENIIVGDYPLFEVEVDGSPVPFLDADGKAVPVVTTTGEYRYLGKLVVTFDRFGRVVAFDGNPLRVSGVGADAVAADATLQSEVADPVQAFVDTLSTTIFATSEVALDGRRDGSGAIGIRNRETNLGNLVADSILWQAQELADDFGVAAPRVSLQNGGGIRNSSLIPAGDLSLADAADILAFTNFTTIVPNVTPAELKLLLENSVSQRPSEDGKFGQWGGLSFEFDATGDAYDFIVNANTGKVETILNPGSRVSDVWLIDANGAKTTQLIDASGNVVAGAPTVNLATIDFLVKNDGDEYPFELILGGDDFVSVGVTYRTSLINYITNALGGNVTAAQRGGAYAEGVNQRIVDVTP